MKTILFALVLFVSNAALATEKSCLVTVIEKATEAFQEKNLNLAYGPKVTAHYVNRNVYVIAFEYTLEDYSRAKTSYMVLSDYSENFVSMRPCQKIRYVGENASL